MSFPKTTQYKGCAVLSYDCTALTCHGWKKYRGQKLRSFLLKIPKRTYTAKERTEISGSCARFGNFSTENRAVTQQKNKTKQKQTLMRNKNEKALRNEAVRWRKEDNESHRSLSRGALCQSGVRNVLELLCFTWYLLEWVFPKWVWKGAALCDGLWNKSLQHSEYSCGLIKKQFILFSRNGLFLMRLDQKMIVFHKGIREL